MTPYTQVVLQLNTQGQLIIPIDLQTMPNLKAGDVFCVHVKNNQLILEKQEDIKQKLKNRFATITESLTDELIQERRHMAKLES